MASIFALTAAGLGTPRFPEARQLVVDNWKAKFGENAQTASDSPDGQVIDVLALLLTLLWEADGEIWANSFFRTSSGNSLDLILDLFAKQRLPATFSTASAVWYGADAIGIPDLSQASNGQGQRFEVPTGTAGITGELAHVVRIQDAVDTDSYTVDVNGTPFTHVAGPADTVLTIAEALETLINAGAEPIVSVAIAVEDANGFGLIVLDTTAGANVVTTAGTGTLDAQFGARVPLTATATGPTAALAGTLTVIETPIASIIGVVNSTDATLGRDRESDAAYKQRHLETINAQGCGTVQAIEDRVLQRVDDVISVKVFENDTDVVDGDGRPPHSFETFVLGGEDAAIAQEIFDCKPAGIETVGDISILTPGASKPTKFSRPTSRYLHEEITVTKGEGFPTTGDPAEAIKQAVATFLAPGGEGELTQGDDLYRVQQNGVITDAVPGISTIVIETDDTPNPGDAPVFTPSDIVVTNDEILISDSSRITVIIVP